MNESYKGIEFVKCNLCGEDNTKLLFQAPVRDYRSGVYNRDIWDIVQCENCDLIYTNPRIDDDARAGLYSFKTPGDEKFVKEWFIENADLQRHVWQRFLGAVQQYDQPGRLLDIGCGAGAFLVEARKNGYDVVGQEVSGFFIEYCRESHHLEIYDDFLENLEIPEQSFDFVTIFDVIEHHPNPDLLLKQINSLLKPNGIIVVGTHDIGNWIARYHGVNWRYIKPIGHITYFTRKTLMAMLKKNGFDILQVGGSHTIDKSKTKRIKNNVVQFLRLILFRSLILFIYKPITKRIPRLTRWEIKLGKGRLNHKKLLMRAGDQVNMNDNMLIIARKKE